MRIESPLGPMNVMPASAHARVNSGFSDRKPSRDESRRRWFAWRRRGFFLNQVALASDGGTDVHGVVGEQDVGGAAIRIRIDGDGFDAQWHVRMTRTAISPRFATSTR